MNGKTGGNRGPWRAAALAVVAAVAVLATACGGGSASTSASSASSDATFANELAFAQCMRGHGVPNFPDPSPEGGFTLPAGLNGSQVQAAYGTCRHLLPGGGPSLASIQAKIQQALTKVLRMSQCMRGHGVPNFPDPTTEGTNISLNLNGSGIDPQSPQFLAAARACHFPLPDSHAASSQVRASKS